MRKKALEGVRKRGNGIDSAVRLSMGTYDQCAGVEREREREENELRAERVAGKKREEESGKTQQGGSTSWR